MNGTSYPVSFSVNYPERELSRLTSFFRIFTIIPIAIVLGAVGGGTTTSRSASITRTRTPRAT